MNSTESCEPRSLVDSMANSASAFRGLHSNTTPMRLPNAWDAGSARLFESLGAEAIATTSAGSAWSLGYRDGRALVVDELVASAARMARVLAVPLSVDIENGYSDNPAIVADLVKRLIDLGVAGINIEDGTDERTVLAAKIEAIKNAVSRAGADLFVNARSDVFLANLGEKSKLIEESLVRGGLYASAGADGLFLPGIAQAADRRDTQDGSHPQALECPDVAPIVDLTRQQTVVQPVAGEEGYVASLQHSQHDRCGGWSERRGDFTNCGDLQFVHLIQAGATDDADH